MPRSTRRQPGPAIVGALLLALAQAPAAWADGGPVGLFGYLEFASPDLAALPVWRDTLARLAADRTRAGECDEDDARCEGLIVTVWRAKVQELANLPIEGRLGEVNRYVNGLGEVKIATETSRVERWAAPFEFLEKGGGAAEFAIMKFATLRDAGVENGAMRIAVVYDALRNRRHAVLVVRREDGGFRVLDTWSNAVLDASRVKYYVPLYSVNETTRWAHVVNRPLADSAPPRGKAK